MGKTQVTITTSEHE